MVKFRIVKLDRKVYKYRVDQRHWFLFIPYWDTGAESLCPKYFFETKEEALLAIAKAVTKEEETK